MKLTSSFLQRGLLGLFVILVGGVFLWLSTRESKTTPIKSPPMAAIEDFYRSYIGTKNHANIEDFEKKLFSPSFLELSERNHQICKEKAGTDVCGWDADGDPFYNSQEVDPALTFANSNFLMKMISDSVIEVYFNLFPTSPNPFYDRRIQFTMIEVNGEWKADDMAWVDDEGPQSVRKLMQQEIDFYMKPPSAFPDIPDATAPSSGTSAPAPEEK